MKTSRSTGFVRVAFAMALCALALLLVTSSASSAVGGYEGQLSSIRGDLIAMRDGLTTANAKLWLSRSVASLGWSIGSPCWTNSGMTVDPATGSRCLNPLTTTVNRLVLNDADLRGAADAQIRGIVDVAGGLATDAYNALPKTTDTEKALAWKVQYDLNAASGALAVADYSHALAYYIRAWQRIYGSGGPAATITLGDTTLQGKVDYNPEGKAEAFQVTAGGSGVATLNLWVDPSSTATSLVAGIYADGEGGPGQLLAQGSTPLALGGGEWNAVHIPQVALTPGNTYWVAILTPVGGGTLRFRDRCCHSGGTALTATSAATDLTALPDTWATDRQFMDGPLSLFGSF
jgi:hypothetical protein